MATKKFGKMLKQALTYNILTYIGHGVLYGFKNSGKECLQDFMKVALYSSSSAVIAMTLDKYYIKNLTDSESLQYSTGMTISALLTPSLPSIISLSPIQTYSHYFGKNLEYKMYLLNSVMQFKMFKDEFEEEPTAEKQKNMSLYEKVENFLNPLNLLNYFFDF